MKRIMFSITTIICVIFSLTPVYAEGEPKETELYARSACLMDADSGRILYGKDEGNKLANASTTKIMTCIIALEEGNLEDVATASSRAARQPKVHLGVSEGDQFLLNDLLYSLMLESHNDSAVMIAEQVSGSVEAFTERMNQKAKEIGCENTHFVTPNGLDGEDEGGKHGTTAAELALIMRYCIMESPKRDQFLEITRTPSYTFWNVEQTKHYNCNNHNAFLGMMDGALSGKTGFTGDAGYCYIGALERDGRTFIVALLACGWPNNKTYKWSDTKKLMTYAVEQYQYRDILQRDFSCEPVEVTDGQYKGLLGKDCAKTNLTLNLADDESFSMLLRNDEEVDVIYELPDSLKAPVKAGSKVGRVRYILGDELLKEYPVYTAETVKKIDFIWCFDIIKNKYLLMRDEAGG